MPTFVNPLALWGLALASAPIIIHLLNRRRFKVLEWAAMEFLLASSRKNYRRIRIEQLILLALRVLLIVVLVLLVARPVVRQRALGAVAERRRFVLLVFDTSMSMGYRDGSMTSYDRGLAFAEELMGSLREGDTWGLVAAVGRGRAIVQEPSFDLEAARAAVAPDRLPLSDDGGSLPRALEAAEEILTRVRVPVKDVFIVTDAQRVSWVGPTGTVAAEDAERAKRLGQAARVVLVDVGAQDPSNLAVTALENDNPLVVAGGEALVRAEVANFGAATATGVSVQFLVDGFRQQKGAPRSISPGGTAQWEFRDTFRTPGAHTVTAELDGDNLPKDDRRFLAVDARESVLVLCVDGEPGGDAFTGETDFLRRSLQPGEEAEGRLSLFKPEVVTPEALALAELPRYDAVVLANVEKLPETAVAGLENYVREGGALLVFPGDKVDRGFYNTVLYKGGQGLLPCSFGEPVGDADDRKHPVKVSDEVGTHPFVRLFREQKVIRLSSPLFYRYLRLEDTEGQKETHVVCRFDDGAAAIVEAARGRGRVAVFASTADNAWNDMPSWPAYLALMQEVMSQVARDPAGSRNVTVGEPLVRHVSPRQFGKPAQLLRPGESQPVALQATSASGLLAVTYDRTDRAGVYELLLPGEGEGKAGDRLERRQDFFAVNVPARESDVRRLSEAELRKLFPGFEFAYQRGGVRRMGPASAPSEGGELWRTLAFALLGLLLVEAVLAQRFGR